MISAIIYIDTEKYLKSNAPPNIKDNAKLLLVQTPTQRKSTTKQL